MRQGASFLGVLILSGLVLAGCQPIPTAPESDSIRDRTYTNDEWGFSVTAPQDSAWSLSATQLFAVQEPNGLSPVQVILRQRIPGSAARPAMEINSFGLAQATELDDLVVTFENLFREEFPNYDQRGQKTASVLAGVPSVEWSFRAREPQSGIHFLNARYLAFVFARGDEVFQVLCSGQPDNFPETEFRSILSTFTFTE